MSHEGTPPSSPWEDPDLLTQLYRMYRDYFDKAEKKRRWSIREDIPWDQCNRSLHPAVADVVETFCAVELYLPDYVSKLIPQVRANRGRAWFVANWGYEESKHSLALGDWLLKSGHRTDEQMADLETCVFKEEYDLPHDNPLAMACYTTMQELATWVHYRNLRQVVNKLGGDPALDKILSLISIDERAHYDFFSRMTQVYLACDREKTLEQMRRVFNTFEMPAVNLLADSAKRAADVRALEIFNEHIFFGEVFEPYMAGMGLTKADLKQRNSKREVVVMRKSTSTP
jgi:acyl-[acyl-carrier-protein] desaturase